MGWLIAAGILLLIGLTPVGVSLIYGQDGLFLNLLAGILRFRLYPRTKKEKKSKPEKKPAAKQQPTTSRRPSEKQKTGGKLTDFIPLLETAMDFLGSFRKKLRVRCLQLDLVMAGDDPCDLAVNYGKAWAAVGNLMPLLEQVFVIRKRNVQVNCDFTADATVIYLRLDVTITVGRILGLGIKYGVQAIIKYLKIMKMRKGGAES